MRRKIEPDKDKNFFDPAKDAPKQSATLLMDDLAKTPAEAIKDAVSLAWNDWIGSEPLAAAYTGTDGTAYCFFLSEKLKDRVILLIFWDYTLLPCRRALSYVNEWQRRYSTAGLIVVGVHSPRFKFGTDRKFVTDAMKELGIAFPVVLDNKFDYWKAFENTAWPRTVLFDPQAKTHLDRTGEGLYPQFEKNIQLLLRQLSPGLACPSVMRPLRVTDKDDYVVPETTPELFFGLERKVPYGNAQVPTTINTEVVFEDISNGSYAEGHIYFKGSWLALEESMYAHPLKGHKSFTVSFRATDVYIVARTRPKTTGDVPQGVRVQITIDKKVVSDEKLGEASTINEYRRSVASIRDPKTYHLVRGLEHGVHELGVIVEDNPADTLEIYAIFFEHNG